MWNQMQLHLTHISLSSYSLNYPTTWNWPCSMGQIPMLHHWQCLLVLKTYIHGFLKGIFHFLWISFCELWSMQGFKYPKSMIYWHSKSAWDVCSKAQYSYLKQLLWVRFFIPLISKIYFCSLKLFSWSTVFDFVEMNAQTLALEGIALLLVSPKTAIKIPRSYSLMDWGTVDSSVW